MISVRFDLTMRLGILVGSPAKARMTMRLELNLHMVSSLANDFA